MRQFRMAMGMIAVATIASGCGGDSPDERTATKVLRPEQVKITLGSDPAPAEMPQSTPAPPSEGPAPE